MACGERFTLLELVEEMEGMMDKKAEPEFAPPRPGEVKRSLATVEKAHERLGYTPVVRFAGGIRRAVTFFEAKSE